MLATLRLAKTTYHLPKHMVGGLFQSIIGPKVQNIAFYSYKGVKSLAPPTSRDLVLNTYTPLSRFQQLVPFSSGKRTKICNGDGEDKDQSKSSSCGPLDTKGKGREEEDECEEHDLENPSKESPECNDSYKKFTDKNKQEEEAEKSECSEAESEHHSDSEEETPIKKCEDDFEDKKAPPDDKTDSKAATEICECLKAAVAKAVADQTKGKGSGGAKMSGLCGPLEQKGDSKPKISEHVQSCEGEKSSSSRSSDQVLSGVEKCKKKCADEAAAAAAAAGKKLPGKSPKNKTCACIKQILGECNKPKPKESMKADNKKGSNNSDEKKGKKSVNKKGEGQCTEFEDEPGKKNEQKTEKKSQCKEQSRTGPTGRKGKQCAKPKTVQCK